MFLAVWGGFAAERDLFFPGPMPEPAAPILGAAISTGSVIAVALPAVFLPNPCRRYRCRGDAAIEALEKVTAFGKDVAHKLSLSAGPANRLELCLEESVTQLVADGDPGRTVRIEASATEDEVELVMTDRSDLRDVELPNVPTDLLQADDNQLQDLGLVLLSRMASHVSHTTISGWHYVSFVIDRHGQAVNGARLA